MSELIKVLKDKKFKTKKHYVTGTDICMFTNTFISPNLINKDKKSHPAMIFGIMNNLWNSLPVRQIEWDVMQKLGYKVTGGGDGGHYNLLIFRPVVPDSVIYGEVEVTNFRQSRSKPELWIITRHWIVKDGKDDSKYMEFDQDLFSFYIKE